MTPPDPHVEARTGWHGAPTGAERLYEALYGERRRGVVASEDLLHEAANAIWELRRRLEEDRLAALLPVPAEGAKGGG